VVSRVEKKRTKAKKRRKGKKPRRKGRKPSSEEKDKKLLLMQKK
jgi:hypothetical protein